MERIEFQQLLFQTAFCVVASDGHIDEREIEELRALEGSAVYFQGVDLRGHLDELVARLQSTGRPGEVGNDPIRELLKKIEASELSVVQELLLLELALRILHADTVVHEREVSLIREVRRLLSAPDEILLDRFGPDPALFQSDYETPEHNQQMSSLVSEIETLTPNAPDVVETIFKKEE